MGPTSQILKVSMDDQQRVREMIFRKNEALLSPKVEGIILRPKTAVNKKVTNFMFYNNVVSEQSNRLNLEE